MKADEILAALKAGAKLIAQDKTDGQTWCFLSNPHKRIRYVQFMALLRRNRLKMTDYQNEQGYIHREYVLWSQS